MAEINMSFLIDRSSPKEDIQEEEAERRLSEAGATHPSGFIGPSSFSHRAGRFDGVQPGRGGCLLSAQPLATQPRAANVPVLFAVAADHHRQNVVPRGERHLPGGLLQHTGVRQHEEPRSAVSLHLPNQGWWNRSSGTHPNTHSSFGLFLLFRKLKAWICSLRLCLKMILRMLSWPPLLERATPTSWRSPLPQGTAPSALHFPQTPPGS